MYLLKSDFSMNPYLSANIHYSLNPFTLMEGEYLRSIPWMLHLHQGTDIFDLHKNFIRHPKILHDILQPPQLQAIINIQYVLYTLSLIT